MRVVQEKENLEKSCAKIEKTNKKIGQELSLTQNSQNSLEERNNEVYQLSQVIWYIESDKIATFEFGLVLSR